MESVKETMNKIREKRHKLFGIANVMAMPAIEKVVLNARIKKGGNVEEETVLATLQKITGQKAVSTKARKSISNFKIREGMVVGAMVTLRGQRAYDFLDKLINVALPRVRDFSGLAERSLDKEGNLTLGLAEHIVFPEAAEGSIEKLHGLQITVKTTAKTREQAAALFKELGFPFKK